MLGDLSLEGKLRTQVKNNNLKIAMERLSWTYTLEVNSPFLSYFKQVFPEQLQLSLLQLASTLTGESLDD